MRRFALPRCRWYWHLGPAGGNEQRFGTMKDCAMEVSLHQRNEVGACRWITSYAREYRRDEGSLTAYLVTEEQIDCGTDSSSAAEGSASLGNPGTVSRADLSGLDHLLQRQMLLLSAQHFRRRLRPPGNAHQAREGAEQRQVLQHVELHWRAAAPPGIAS